MNPIVVIGAGPGGSVAAALLARGGLPTLLVEQTRFPRDKVCGECVSAMGWEVLARIGVTNELKSAGAVELTRTQLHSADGRVAELVLPRAMWGISRAVMDSVLLDAARAAGAEVRMPARCERIELGHTPRMRIREITTNEVTSVVANCVVLADGKSALMPPRPRSTGDLGIKAHFIDVQAEANAIALFGVDGHYGGVAPIEGGRWNVAFSMPRPRVEKVRDLDELFATVLMENATLAACFRNARRVSEWLASPLPRFGVRRRWPAGVIPIGNAAAALEPVGGEGMGLAMRSAELAAEEIIRSIRTNSPVRQDALRRRFCALWGTRRLACRAAALWVSSPELCGQGLDWLGGSNQLSRLALSLVGK